MSYLVRYSRLIYLTSLAIHRPSLYRHLPIAPPTITRSIFTSRPCLSKRDFYEVLGVSKSATDDKIKQAYFILAVQYHPDRNKDPRAKVRFIEIGNAYEVLSNTEKRQLYDLTKHRDQKQRGNESSDQDFKRAQLQFDTFTEESPNIISWLLSLMYIYAFQYPLEMIQWVYYRKWTYKK